jgi:5-methylcytosine-specific restriction endonuclease McrA
MSNSTCTPDDCQNRGPRGGLCKRCWADRSLASYYANKEARNAYNREWRAANPDRVKANFKAYYDANAEMFAKRYKDNREDLLERKRKKRAANPGGENHHSRAWRKANPEKWALRNRENQRRRRGDKPVNYSAIIERDGMVCHICTDPIEGLTDLHMDHVIPLARGGAHHEDNIKPSHALCNMRKSDKIA